MHSPLSDSPILSDEFSAAHPTSAAGHRVQLPTGNGGSVCTFSALQDTLVDPSQCFRGGQNTSRCSRLTNHENLFAYIGRADVSSILFRVSSRLTWIMPAGLGLTGRQVTIEDHFPPFASVARTYSTGL